MKSLKEITTLVDDFSDRRGWKNDNPNHLITSMLIEMGELAEYYQWKNQFEEFDEKKKLELGYEFVDVLFYFLRLASKSGIDIEKYFDDKLPKLEKKFPLGTDSIKQHEKYRVEGRNKTYD